MCWAWQQRRGPLRNREGEGLPFERLGNINQTCTEHLRGINKVSVIAVDCSNELDLAIVQSVWVEVHCGLGKTRWEEKADGRSGV